ncbi:hypothetical protein [Marinoscillum pacificum]|uniref:hypothetical protein n=1 Tax=Marinoscillum pacificum TaxID=392723 RepID=UPI002158332F|nr:hypothetical protein [Marinoscillum pacificum]
MKLPKAEIGPNAHVWGLRTVKRGQNTHVWASRKSRYGENWMFGALGGLRKA